MADDLLEQYRKQESVPSMDVPLDKYLDWLDEQEKTSLIIDGASAEEEVNQIAIEGFRDMVLDGVSDEMQGRLKIIKGLLALKENDLWQKDILVAHIENPRWKQDYLVELIEWLKERNPHIQAGLSTLMNYMRYHLCLVDGLGLDEELVFGAAENTRRAIMKMADWDHGGGLPKRLRNGYDLEKLPQPPLSTGEETWDEKVVSGITEVAKQALSLGRYSPDLFEAYHAGDGQEKTAVSMVLKLDKGGVVSEWTAFIKKVDGEGNPLESYAANIFGEEMPCEVLDWLEARQFHVEMDA